MLPLTRRAIWHALFLLCALLFINGVDSEGRVVCYYTNWSVYRPGTAKFNPQNINPYLCTHLVYAFGGFTKDNQMKPFDKYQDIEQGGYAKFTGLKTYNKQLKTMIAIGGWNEASSRFSPLMANPERRHQFIKNILKFLRQNHFDGIDLDWEYPAHREGGKARDRDNYAQFVQELRAEFEREAEKTGRPRLLVTMAVPAGIEYVEKGYDIPKLNKYLDWFNILTYDFHSSHEPSVNHHAPLYSLEEESEYNYDTELNIDYAVKFYLKAGADRDKLVLGIPTYGRSYTLINEESTELGAPAEGPGEQGDATREKGYLAYYEICQNLKEDAEWTVVQPNPNAMGPYAYRRNQWVGYDDESIVRKKADYVVENGLGGIMFWAIDNDDFRGTCTGKPYPLIEAAKSAMLEGLGLGINEVSKPSKPKKPSRSRSRGDTSSTRNRISGTISEKPVKETIRGGSRKRVKTSTTTQAPSTTFKLTNPEGSSLYIGGRTTTPAPPTTPDPGADFKCEEEGFFQHPRDCKKYFWCLDSGPSGLGIVAHQFTCPSGLYFNPAADSCDFARNVPCKTKKSTTAAPITTTSTTTSKPTSAPRATSTRASYLRTTSTTTTTLAPLEEYEDEEEEEEEDVDDDEPRNQSKDKEAEEDPKVIKELIDLIRKVGGIEELEKHLLRKEDGTISIKENEAIPTGASTTSSPISKQLYDKLLNRPKSYNSFRNRYASTLRTKGQTKTEENEKSSVEQVKKGDSKFSSVVRGNFRTVPQNDGLEKLPEFDGFLKERKQYVTISRNRGTNSQQTDDEYADSIAADEEDEEVDEEVKPKSTQRPLKTVTPSYSSIRRSRPTTTKEPLLDDDEEDEVEQEEVTKDKKTYSNLSRTRGRYSSKTQKTTTEEATTASNRYKFFERTRPTKSTTSKTVDDSRNEETNIDADEDESDELEDEQENVKLQLNSSHLATETTPQSAQTTTRAYSNIGRRRPTTTAPTTETPEKSVITTETPNNLENLITNESPEPIERTTTTSRPATNTPKIIAINETSSSSTPIITTSISNEISSDLSATKTSNENLFISFNLNSLVQEPPSDQLQPTIETSTKSETTINENSTIDGDSIPVTAKTTTKTLTTTGTTDGDQQTQDADQTEDEVTKTKKILTKTTQPKSTIRTRNKPISTLNNGDKQSKQNTITIENNSNEENTQTSLKNVSNPLSKTRDSVQTQNSGGRRQQLPKRRTQQQRTNGQINVVSETPTTETIPTNNEISGKISSPRPFGFPKRRTPRPNVRTSTETTTTSNTTTSQESNTNGGSLVKTRFSRVNDTQKVSYSSEEDVISTKNIKQIKNTQKHAIDIVGKIDSSLSDTVENSRAPSLSNHIDTDTSQHDKQHISKDTADDIGSHVRRKSRRRRIKVVKKRKTAKNDEIENSDLSNDNSLETTTEHVTTEVVQLSNSEIKKEEKTLMEEKINETTETEADVILTTENMNQIETTESATEAFTESTANENPTTPSESLQDTLVKYNQTENATEHTEATTTEVSEQLNSTTERLETITDTPIVVRLKSDLSEDVKLKDKKYQTIERQSRVGNSDSTIHYFTIKRNNDGVYLSDGGESSSFVRKLNRGGKRVYQTISRGGNISELSSTEATNTANVPSHSDNSTEVNVEPTVENFTDRSVYKFDEEGAVVTEKTEKLEVTTVQTSTDALDNDTENLKIEIDDKKVELTTAIPVKQNSQNKASSLLQAVSDLLSVKVVRYSVEDTADYTSTEKDSQQESTTMQPFNEITTTIESTSTEALDSKSDTTDRSPNTTEKELSIKGVEVSASLKENFEVTSSEAVKTSDAENFAESPTTEKKINLSDSLTESPVRETTLSTQLHELDEANVHFEETTLTVEAIENDTTPGSKMSFIDEHEDKSEDGIEELTTLEAVTDPIFELSTHSTMEEKVAAEISTQPLSTTGQTATEPISETTTEIATTLATEISTRHFPSIEKTTTSETDIHSEYKFSSRKSMKTLDTSNEQIVRKDSHSEFTHAALTNNAAQYPEITTWSPPNRKTYRGTYRPKDNEEDLSSLLALDRHKQERYRLERIQQANGKSRRPVDRTTKANDLEDGERSSSSSRPTRPNRVVENLALTRNRNKAISLQRESEEKSEVVENSNVKVISNEKVKISGDDNITLKPAEKTKKERISAIRKQIKIVGDEKQLSETEESETKSVFTSNSEESLHTSDNKHFAAGNQAINETSENASEKTNENEIVTKNPSQLSSEERNNSTEQQSEGNSSSSLNNDQVNRQRFRYSNRGRNSNARRISSSFSDNKSTDGTTKIVDSDGNIITQTRNTYTKTYDIGDNKRKTIKRVQTKTIKEQRPEYEYIYELITEKPLITTPRVVSRQRGSVKFQSSDLSSLLSGDFAFKPQRRTQTVQENLIKTRVRRIKKPKQISESENISEYEYEDDLTPETTSTTTQKPITSRRTRPTRNRVTTTTKAPEIYSTIAVPNRRRPTSIPTKRGMPFSRSTQRTTSTQLTAEEPKSIEAIPETTENNIFQIEQIEKENKTEEVITTTLSSEEHDTLDQLKEFLSNALNKLATDVDEASNATQQNISADSEQIQIENLKAELKNELNEEDESLSLPIYHRRKYYQYYNDSPVTYVGKSVPEAQPNSKVDIKKQILDVFNVSQDHLITPAISEETENRLALEQAKEINAELSHFFVKPPGSV